MSGQFFLDWAILAISLANTILLLWLGLTVLLNAERRTTGIWLAGGGLLMGSAFFFSHSAIVGRGLNIFGPGADLWWHLGWIPVILAPFAWYVVMLWYAGYWEDPAAAIHHRHRIWLGLLGIATIAMLALLLIANPLPSFANLVQYNLSATLALFGIPLLFLIYPPYIILCICLSLEALLRPGPTMRMMGQLARQRARPWLTSATLVLLLVSLLVAGIIAWVVLRLHQSTSPANLAIPIAWADLIIASFISAATLLTGQAIVSYEIFTGKTLPRRGLLRYWQRAIILAAGYSLLVALSLTLDLRAIYSMLLSTGLMIIFYALLSWRSYAERENFITSLRPFVASPKLYEQLRAPSAPPASFDARQPFDALCDQVLGTRLAYLVPMGSLAPLFGSPLVFPPAAALPGGLPKITEKLSSPQTLCLPLEAGTYGEAAWGVPLWGGRGLTGLLLLGNKRDSSLYTQEEIEIARMVSERLIDMQASAEIARRLMALQRQQLAESQLLDHRTRRILHDEVLPRLHAAMLTLNQEEPASTVASLADIHHQVSDLLHDIPTATAPEVTRFGLVGALRQVVEGELKNAFDQVSWQVDPQAEVKSESLPPLTAEVLLYAAREAIRNAARHGRDPLAPADLNLQIGIRWQDGPEIIIEDNGVGLANSYNKEGGSGQGLALHSTMLAVIGGSLSIESIPGRATRLVIRLPLDSMIGGNP